MVVGSPDHGTLPFLPRSHRVFDARNDHASHSGVFPIFSHSTGIPSNTEVKGI